MRAPRVDPVGLVERPAGYAVAPRAYPPAVRWVSALILAAFVAVSTATTVSSLGAYCLTSYAGVPFAPWP